MTRFEWQKDRLVKFLTLDTVEPQYDHSPIVLDPENVNFVVYYFTAEQWRKMYEAILSGADTVHPDDSHEVVSSFLWPMEYPVSICDLVAQCIIDSIGTGNSVEQAIQLWLETNLSNIIEGGSSASQESGLAATDVFTGDCDNDVVFAFCRQTVQWLHSIILDLYEVLEVLTNFLEFYSQVAQASEKLAFFLEWVQFMQNTLVENYLAEYTTEVENELACDLFCRALREDCVLTWHELTNYFVGRFQKSIESITFEDLLDYWLTGSWSGTEFVDISFAMVTYLLTIGGEFAGWSLQDAITILASFSNDSDSDWEIVCDECVNVWLATFDLTDAQHGWDGTETQGMETQGEFQNGVGIVANEHYYAPEYRVAFSIGFDVEPFHCLEVSVYFNFTKGSFDNPTYAAQNIYLDGVIKQSVSFADSQNGNGQTLTWEGDEEGVENVSLSWRPNASTSGYAGAATGITVTIKGEGDIPDEIATNASSVEWVD